MAILEDPTGIISRQDIQRELEEDLQSHSTIEHEKMSGDVERIRAASYSRDNRGKAWQRKRPAEHAQSISSKLKLEPERTSNRARRETPAKPKEKWCRNTERDTWQRVGYSQQPHSKSGA